MSHTDNPSRFSQESQTEASANPVGSSHAGVTRSSVTSHAGVTRDMFEGNGATVTRALQKPYSADNCRPTAPDWTPRPTFTPKAGNWYWSPWFAGSQYVLEPSLKQPGCWFVSRLYEGGDAYDCTARPVGADWVQETLRHYGLVGDPSAVQWLIGRSAGVRIAMETLNAPETTAANLQRTEPVPQAIERMRAQGVRA